MYHIKKYPSKEEISERFNHVDGVLYYKTKVCNRVKIGDAAGSINNNGQAVIKIKGSSYSEKILMGILLDE